MRQKLNDATLELETMKNIKMELFNLLKMAYQERDEARCQLQKLMNNLVLPSSPIHLQESLLMFPCAKAFANPSITDSSSLSHGSPPVDSFFDTVSSPEFSNINTVDSNNNNNNMAYLNHHHQQQHLVQDFNCLASSSSSPSPALMMMVPLEKPPPSDPATEVIDCLAKKRVLPQKGKLLQAVIDAGPLLQTILLAGPLPNWRNPPPLQDIKVPPLNIKEYDTTTSMEPNSFPKPKPSFLQSSNVPSTCSASMLNFAGNPSGSWNNSWQFSSSSGVRIQVPSRKRRQMHQ